MDQLDIKPDWCLAVSMSAACLKAAGYLWLVWKESIDLDLIGVVRFEEQPENEMMQEPLTVRPSEVTLPMSSCVFGWQGMYGPAGLEHCIMVIKPIVRGNLANIENSSGRIECSDLGYSDYIQIRKSPSQKSEE
ncbi:hypothetical protein CLU79DRAFT_837703 [Phycomyces nitens]|nr:hypothetical protein CLU79DRAFT_837703 [Phycomyces nitens]